MSACDAKDLFSTFLAGRGLKSVFRHHYLMNVLLALPTAHRAELDQPRSEYSPCQATQLQPRGLILFNQTNTDMSEQTCVELLGLA